jgi:hypothetical protein
VPYPEVTYDQVSAKMKALEGWVQVYVMSYVQPGAEGKKPQRCYRLFGTSVAG